MEIPIPALSLFAPLDAMLIALLKSLGPADWQRRTVAREWTVKDVAAHLLDGNIRTVSLLRDKFNGDPPDVINNYKELVTYLNRLNADWVRAMKRVSPETLVILLEETGKEYMKFLHSLDPFAPATFAVSWAGEEVSANWFHIAREYTEKWHHQQQIREAVDQPGIITREFYFPVLDTFMRALPYSWRTLEAPDKTEVSVSVLGEAGGHWAILKNKNAWVMISRPLSPDCEIIIPQDIAWKLFTRAITGETAKNHVSFNGNEKYGEPILNMITVMA